MQNFTTVDKRCATNFDVEVAAARTKLMFKERESNMASNETSLGSVGGVALTSSRGSVVVIDVDVGAGEKVARGDEKQVGGKALLDGDGGGHNSSAARD